jgi:predicted nucleotidyltransferase
MNARHRSQTDQTDQILNQFRTLISPLRGQIKKMYLFGSRSRDDWRPDSDYDVLIVLEKRETWIADRLYDAVIDLLLSSGKLISLKIFNVAEFERLRSIPTPFMKKVVEEGINIGFNN